MSDKEHLHEHLIEDVAEDTKINRRMVIGTWMAMAGIFQWYDSKNREEHRHHQDHPNLHTNGITDLRDHVRDNYVPKEAFDQLLRRVEALENANK